MCSRCGKELGPQRGIAFVLASPEGGAGQWRRFSYSPHLSTKVMGFEIHGDTVGLKHRIQGISDLLPDPFLHRKTLGEQAHEAGELRNTDNVLVSDISHVGMPVERECVVLTEPKKLDRSLNHLAQAAVWSTTTFGGKHRQQFGIAIIAFGRIKQSLQKALRRSLGGRAIQI